MSLIVNDAVESEYESAVLMNLPHACTELPKYHDMQWRICRCHNDSMFACFRLMMNLTQPIECLLLQHQAASKSSHILIKDIQQSLLVAKSCFLKPDISYMILICMKDILEKVSNFYYILPVLLLYCTTVHGCTHKTPHTIVIEFFIQWSNKSPSHYYIQYGRRLH